MWYVPKNTELWPIPRRVTIGPARGPVETWTCPRGRTELQLAENWAVFHRHMRGHWKDVIRTAVEDFPVDMAVSAVWPSPQEGQEVSTVLFFPVNDEKYAGFLVSQKNLQEGFLYNGMVKRN